MKLAIMSCGLLLLGITVARADLYQWTDEQGVTHVVDDSVTIPEAYRGQVKTYRAAKPTNEGKTIITPSRTYQENSQGAFAQKLALDLGLINNTREDALGPLGTVGIQPAGGWQVSNGLTSETQLEVIAAARRAADSQRIRISADGAEAIVRQTALAFLPPPVVQAPMPPTEYYEEEPIYEQPPTVIIEQESPRIVEIIREPMYIPTPVISGRYHGRRRSDRGFDNHSDFADQNDFDRRRNFDKPQRHQHRSVSPPTFSTPAPTHMPFGASHMPFGTSPTPSGAGRHGR